jgi:hypothetical protein
VFDTSAPVILFIGTEILSTYVFTAPSVGIFGPLILLTLVTIDLPESFIPPTAFNNTILLSIGNYNGFKAP